MGAVVGIDFDTHALYLCMLDSRHAEPRIAAVTIEGHDIAAACQNVPTALAFAMQRAVIPPRTEAWVERGTGASRRGDWPLGAIAGAIIATWPRITAGGACRTITTADWKKAIGAPGNCNKATANHYATLHWRSNHHTLPPPTNHNHLDAYAIALAASTR